MFTACCLPAWFSALLFSATENKENETPSNNFGTSFEEDPYTFIEEEIYEELVPKCQVGHCTIDFTCCN